MATPEEIVFWLENNNSINIEVGLTDLPQITNSNDIKYRVNWDLLFPSQTNNNNIFWDLDLNEIDQEFLNDISRSLESSSPQANEKGEPLEWDVLAWYQPMHFFGNDWGIFITEEGIRRIAIGVARFMPAGTPLSSDLVKKLILAGFTALFLHEQFHHKIESFGIRLHVIEKISRYLPYKKNVYRPTLGTDDNLEEALANADAFLRITNLPYSEFLGNQVGMALKKYLEWNFPFDPPGYRKAVNYLTKYKFNNALNILQSQIQEAKLAPGAPSSDWKLANRLHQSYFKVSDYLWTVVKPGYRRPLLPISPYKSISTREMIKVAENHGYTIKKNAGKGSHVRMEKHGFPSLTIPGNCRDLSVKVTKSTLKTLGKTLNDIPDLIRQ